MSKSSASFLALSCVGFIASAPAHAADPVDRAVPAATAGANDPQRSATAVDSDRRRDDDIIVTGEMERTVESPKATRPLLDTPQTITVIGDQTIRKQNLLTLRDVLQTVPGITFGAGEGGGGYGDSINLRGYSANNDITIDGVRDTAQYSRSETFNLQQVEVYNGANTVFSGSGSVGGNINLVTKVPQPRDLTVAGFGIGSDGYYRATLDSNVRVDDLVAVRLNAVGHKNRIPGRDVERNRRWAVAPSVTIGIDSPTSLTLQYWHQEDENTPVFGVPYYRNAVNDGPLPGIDGNDSAYYGIRNLDAQNITVDQATARFAHAFSDALSIRNLTRWQRIRQDSTTSAPQGVFCLSNGFQPLPAGALATTALACPAATATAAAQNRPNTYYPSGPRGLVRDQLNQLLYNQTDLRASFATFGLDHTFVLGASFAWEDYQIVTGNVLRTATGATVAQPPIDLNNPNTVYTGPLNFIRSGRSEGGNTNAAVYAFDTIAIVPQLELSLGGRYEHNKVDFRADTFSTAVATLGAYTRGADQLSDEKLFSYRAGLNFKPTENTSIYVSYGNSKTPTSASVRAGCGTLIVAANGQVGDPCAVQPETAKNYEAGVKADLFGRRLQLTAAAFRNDRTGYRVATNDPVIPTLQVLDGRSRVDGIALGATGNITKAWSIFANYTYLDGEIRQSVSNFCLANPGRLVSTTTNGVTTVTNPCGNTAAIPDVQAGQSITNNPRHSGSLFTTYQLPFGVQIGYGLTYQGSFLLNNRALAAPTNLTSTAVTPIFRSEDYLFHRLFLSWSPVERITAQVNVQNLTNERYFTSIRNNGWATPGEARTVQASLFYSF